MGAYLRGGAYSRIYGIRDSRQVYVAMGRYIVSKVSKKNTNFAFLMKGATI